MAKVFFSYSHKDETLRDELEIHLEALKRQGIIETWHDRRIGAGKDFENEISQNLEEADIILLLVSPYFIASEYCYEKEMMRAMDRNKSGVARVIPVILEPTYWQKLPFGKLMAIPKDGKPITKFPNQHDAFLEIIKSIEEVANELGAIRKNTHLNERNKEDLGSQKVDVHKLPRTSNLRIKKDFSEFEKDAFLIEAYEYMARFFEESLIELEKRNSDIKTDFRRIDTNHFMAAVYMDGSEKNRCTIWLGAKHHPFAENSINYSIGDARSDNSYNETILVDNDGYTMFLKTSGMRFLGQPVTEQMTFEGGSEYYWTIFIKPMQ